MDVTKAACLQDKRRTRNGAEIPTRARRKASSWAGSVVVGGKRGAEHSVAFAMNFHRGPGAMRARAHVRTRARARAQRLLGAAFAGAVAGVPQRLQRRRGLGLRGPAVAAQPEALGDEERGVGRAAGVRGGAPEPLGLASPPGADAGEWCALGTPLRGREERNPAKRVVLLRLVLCLNSVFLQFTTSPGSGRNSGAGPTQDNETKLCRIKRRWASRRHLQDGQGLRRPGRCCLAGRPVPPISDPPTLPRLDENWPASNHVFAESGPTSIKHTHTHTQMWLSRGQT